MSDKSISQIILIVGFTLFWQGISLITKSDAGIYGGLASIFVMIMTKGFKK